LARGLHSCSLPKELRICAPFRAENKMDKKAPVGLILGIAIASLGVGASATWLITQRAHAAAGPVAKPITRGQIVKLEGFTVNLADPEASHFLRLTIALEVDHLPDAEKEKVEAALPIARIRDVILSVLTAAKADVLLTPEGKNQLKKSVLESLRTGVPEITIRDIYFTEFLVQR
jgi:flagellar basal body-associated protein FliL